MHESQFLPRSLYQDKLPLISYLRSLPRRFPGVKMQLIGKAKMWLKPFYPSLIYLKSVYVPDAYHHGHPVPFWSDEN
ncbi:hypothetical protein FXE09_10505 [Aggregatibacter actinomycetemcomitans]|nr:hypothetical protein FXE09_10505 [Aggregatibacter actinomycetemcomitans]